MAIIGEWRMQIYGAEPVNAPVKQSKEQMLMKAGKARHASGQLQHFMTAMNSICEALRGTRKQSFTAISCLTDVANGFCECALGRKGKGSMKTPVSA